MIVSGAIFSFEFDLILLMAQIAERNDFIFSIIAELLPNVDIDKTAVMLLLEKK